jgi:hypothetical protein
MPTHGGLAGKQLPILQKRSSHWHPTFKNSIYQVYFQVKVAILRDIFILPYKYKDNCFS